ncbi:glycosyltransferase family 4 protein [Microbacteriaceae bacterium VKM Ac-2855]|nr:glycosyltransferase family 4 protein [Microbacteriaceae bacterium VKM Ac-2855]
MASLRRRVARRLADARRTVNPLRRASSGDRIGSAAPRSRSGRGFERRGDATIAAQHQRWLVGVTEYAGLTGYTGGIGRHYASLLPALVRSGADVDLVVFADEPARQAPDGVRIVAWHRLDRIARVVRPVVRAVLLRRAFDRGRYDVVFAPEWAGVAGLLPRPAPVITNLATSTRVANLIAGFSLRSFGMDAFAVAVQSLLEERQIHRSRGVVPISRAMLEVTRRASGSLPPAAIVRNCIDVLQVQAAGARAAVPAQWPTGPTVLFLGRLERRKGVITAVRAFARVAATDSSVRFVLAGATGDHRFEPSQQELLAMLPEASRDAVVFLGHVGGDELYAGIGAADVVVCPSLWEGFGQVALEAKALGTAVVVTSGSGYDDFCTDDVDALLVPPGDDAALAAAIIRLLSDRELRDRLARTARAGMNDFTADAVAPDLRRAVDRLLE